MAKLDWNNLNRFQRNHVTREHKAFVEIENDSKLSEEQKDVLFIEHYNNLLKQDYSGYKFPTSVPTAGTGFTPPKPSAKNRAAAKAKKTGKAQAKTKGKSAKGEKTGKATKA